MIRCYNKVAIRAVHMYTTEIMENAVNVHLTAELDQLNVISTRDCDFKLTMSLEDQEWTFEKKDVRLTSGLNYLDMDIVLPDAKLWWPAGYGDQPLYNVKVSV